MGRKVGLPCSGVQYHHAVVFSGVQGLFGSHDAEGRRSLGWLYTWSLQIFELTTDFAVNEHLIEQGGSGVNDTKCYVCNR